MASHFDAMEQRMAQEPVLKRIQIIEQNKLEINPYGGITVVPFTPERKSQADFLVVKPKDGEAYIVNLVDNPLYQLPPASEIEWTKSFRKVGIEYKEIEEAATYSDPALAASLALIIYFNNETGKEEGLVAYNCGGNLYLKGHVNWPLLMQVILDSAEMIGAGGSRLMNGTTTALTAIEKMAAEHFGYQYGIFVNTGFNAIGAAIEAIMTSGTKGERMVQAFRADGHVHASVLKPLGELAVQGRILPNKKFNPADPTSLEEALAKSDAPEKVVFINSVGSSDGQIFDLREIQRICKKYGAKLFVDDAHGGYMSKNGKGIADHLGLEEKPDFLFTTESKHKENEGGMLFTDSEIVRNAILFLKQIIFTAAPGPAKLELALGKLEWIMANAEIDADIKEMLYQQLLDHINDDDYEAKLAAVENYVGLVDNIFVRLQKLAAQLLEYLERNGVAVLPTNENTPIYSLLFKIPEHIDRDSDDYYVYSYVLWYVLLKYCRVYANLFVPEGSGKGESLARLSISSAMSPDVINKIGAALVEWNGYMQMLYDYVELNKDRPLQEILDELRPILDQVGPKEA